MYIVCNILNFCIAMLLSRDYLTKYCNYGFLSHSFLVVKKLFKEIYKIKKKRVL